MKPAFMTAVVLGMGAFGLAACEKDIKAPFDRGVCYVVDLGDEEGAEDSTEAAAARSPGWLVWQRVAHAGRNPGERNPCDRL